MTRTWSTGTVELAAGVFAYTQATGGLCISNAGIIAGREQTAVIDALFTPAMTRSLLSEASRLARAPIARAVNTHHHVDHTLGNALLPAGAEIVAHANAKDEMERAGLGVLDIIRRIAPHFVDDLAEPIEARLPDTTFGGAVLETELAGRRARLLHFGTGHTRGDVLVHLPDERIVFAGDIAFFDITPMAHEGHIGNWIEVCRRVIDEVDAETVVPGHGPPGTMADVRRMMAYLELVRDGARAAFDAGVAEREASRSIDLGEYAEWGEPERVRPNVGRLYQEFRGELDSLL